MSDSNRGTPGFGPQPGIAPEDMKHGNWPRRSRNPRAEPPTLPDVEPITIAPCPRPGPAQETAAAASASQAIQKGMSEEDDDITDEDIRLCQRILEHTITNSPQYRLPFTEDTEAWHAVICTILDNDKLSQATTTKAMHLILGRARDGESSTAFPMGPILAECASFSAAAQRSTGSLFLQPASAAHFDTLETTDDGL